MKVKRESQYEKHKKLTIFFDYRLTKGAKVRYTIKLNGLAYFGAGKGPMPAFG